MKEFVIGRLQCICVLLEIYALLIFSFLFFLCVILVVMSDVFMQKFYQKVNDYWRKNQNTTLNHIAVVSVSGGYRDFLMPDSHTSLTGLVENRMAISTVVCDYTTFLHD